MKERILNLLKSAETALADSLAEELSAPGKCKASYDAAAFCAMAFAEVSGRNLRDVEWPSVLLSLANEDSFSPDVRYSATTLSNIYRDCESGNFPPESRADVAAARVCALHITRVVAARLSAHGRAAQAE